MKNPTGEQSVNKMTVKLNLRGVTTVKRNGSPKIYKESTFWNHVRNALRKQGYDVIESNAEREALNDRSPVGLWGDKYTHVVTMRDRSWVLFHNSYAIYNVYEPYNQDGEVDLSIVTAKGGIHYGDNPRQNPSGFGPSVYVITPLTKQCERWLKRYVQAEPWQMMGRGIAIEWRYVDAIEEGLSEAGFVKDKDFSVHS